MRTTSRKRGRPTVADLVPAELQTLDRQRPPPELTDEEVEVWVAVTSSVEADWFNPGNAPLLAQYCRHVIAAKRIAELIERHSGDLEIYFELLKAQREQTSALKTLAASMRIAQQSTRTYRGNARTISQINVPWEKALQGRS
jgi:hypothetical protein